MVFELSEHLTYAAVVFTAILIASQETIVLLLATALLITATYSLIVRMGADYERARVYRIITATLVIAIGGLISTPFALLLAAWGFVTLIIATREHTSHRSYIPVHRS